MSVWSYFQKRYWAWLCKRGKHKDECVYRDEYKVIYVCEHCERRLEQMTLFGMSKSRSLHHERALAEIKRIMPEKNPIFEGLEAV